MIMGLSRMVEECRNCPFGTKCKYKRMESLGYLPDSALVFGSQPTMASVAAPVLRETRTIRIDGENVIVYKDDLEKELYKSLYSGLGLQIGG